MRKFISRNCVIISDRKPCTEETKDKVEKLIKEIA
jgi:hypothetical protein